MTTKLQDATERLWRHERGTALEAFVQLERAKGTSWRLIACEVLEATGVELTHMSLYNWYGEHQAVPA